MTANLIEPRYLSVLRRIHARLGDHPISWAITGSLGMALQGMELPVHDIDIQTDRAGAYEMEGKLAEYIVTPVCYLESEGIRSYLGELEVEGIKVEILGAIQKRIDDQAWEKPVDVEQYRRWVEIDGMQIPVLSLEYEYQAYLKLGRVEKAEMLGQWLKKRKLKR